MDMFDSFFDPKKNNVGIRRNQVEPQQLKDGKVITSPPFGGKIYIEGLTGLYGDLINSESRSASKSLLPTPALKDSSYSEPGEHQRCRDRLEKLNLTYGKSITVFHRYPNMFRAGKKNHRYSQCIKQITIGLSKKNYLSATASVKVQLGDEDVKELFTRFNSLINKP